MCGMKDLKSQASTMGFTAVDGLMMGTRTGNLDPGVLLYLMDYRKMDSKALTSLLYKESGLLGVSGISRIEVCVIPTNEEWIIARHTAQLIG